MAAGVGAGAGAELRLRAAVVRRHAFSFDLFNLGVTLAAVACRRRAPLSPATRARALDLARRLTHYDAPDFCGDDARAAVTL
jgi:hypothetical protein